MKVKSPETGLAVFERRAVDWPNPDGILGIFRKRKRAEAYATTSGGAVVPWDLADGIRLLRLRVFKRDGYRCVRCPRSLTWDSGNLHEKVSRGRGGDRTMDNCEMLCSDCHVGPRGEHYKGSQRAAQDGQEQSGGRTE